MGIELCFLCCWWEQTVGRVVAQTTLATVLFCTDREVYITLKYLIMILLTGHLRVSMY